MRGPGVTRRLLALVWIACCLSSATSAQDVIRLGESEESADRPSSGGHDADAAMRRGFDYEAFQARLEALWFQRKALLEDHRDADAARQAAQIRAYCAEEGVRRVEFMGAALVAEAQRLLADGRHEGALDSLSFAEFFDPGRPQTHVVRARVYWASGAGKLRAAGELFRSATAAFVRSLQDLTLFNQLGLIAVVAVLGCLTLFAFLMLLRYQVPARHEVEEWLGAHAPERWARVGGWTLLALPFLLWFGAGWVAVYWILITFRFMRRSERSVALVLLVLTALSVPAHRIGVMLYGMTVDPLVRATLDAAAGEYDPDRVIKLRQLVDAHPDDPTYRFLLAGLYKNGRYFEEAFDEYKKAIELDQGLEQAHINIGNIFYMTGQYGEAVANYRRASDMNPRAILAHFNAHLAQSEAFRFQEAEESLRRAREIDPKRVTELLSSASGSETRANVEDATIETASIWDAAIRGRPRAASEADDERPGMFGQLLNPVSGIALLTVIACLILQAIGRGDDAARCCIRCGRPFCHYCKSNREGHEYCSQCLHLYVLGDGLAPEAKNHKLYEVARHEQRARRTRRLSSLLLPGAAHFLRDRTWFGATLLFLWLAAMVAWQPSLLVPLEGGLGVDLRLDQLRAATVPATWAVDPLALLAALMLPLIWFAGNFWRWKRREA